MQVIIRSIYTTILYAFILSPSLYLTKMATHKLQRGHKYTSIALSLFAVLIPSLMAGLRGEHVGVDVLVYARPLYDISSRATSLFNFLSVNSRFEIGYRTIGYLASHVFHSFNVHLFLTHLLIVGPIYYGAMLLRDKFEPWVVLLSFYCMFYVETFNIMRQGIAVAFAFLAFAYLLNGNWKKSLIVAVIGYFFHASMVVGYALIVFVYVLHRIKSRTLKVLSLAVITIMVPLLMNYWSQILTFLVLKGIVSARYINYISYLQGGQAYFTRLTMTNYFELGFRWLGVLIPLLASRKSKNSEFRQYDYSILTGVLLGTLLYTSFFVFLHSSYGYRVSFYLEIMFILWFSRLYRRPGSSTESRRSSFIVTKSTAILYLSLFLCFYIGYMVLGFHRTLPFYFQIY